MKTLGTWRSSMGMRRRSLFPGKCWTVRLMIRPRSTVTSPVIPS